MLLDLDCVYFLSDMYDLTPLHYAAHHNNAEIVNMLVGDANKPANVFAQDEM